MAIRIDDIARHARQWTPAAWLTGANVLLFVAVHICAAITRFTSDADPLSMLHALMLPASADTLVSHPWTPVTFMFTHFDVWHLLVNIMWLYLFADVLTRVVSSRRIYTLYLAGGLGGAVAFMCFPAHGSMLTGASSSILALIAAVMIIAPGCRVRLVLFGECRIIWVAAVAVVLMLASTDFSNASGLAAHAGGLAAGSACALLWRLMPQKRHSAIGRNDNVDTSGEPDLQSLDMILDKVRHSGYNSLTQAERHKLFTISHQLSADRKP